jgi:hypothetical protein
VLVIEDLSSDMLSNGRYVAMPCLSIYATSIVQVGRSWKGRTTLLWALSLFFYTPKLHVDRHGSRN